MIIFIIAYDTEIFKSFFKEDEEMYEYTPKREGHTVVHLIFLLLVGGFAILGLATALPALPFRWAFQLVGIGLVGAGVFFYVRYITRTFCYAIVEREDGERDLVITECQRKSRITVCRLSLSGIERVELLPPDQQAKKKALKKELLREGRKLFSYTVNLNPSALACLVATECGQSLAIFFEPDETMLGLLK